MIPTVVAYSDSDNIFKFRLLNKGIPVNLRSVNKIDINLNNSVVVSSASYPNIFDWSFEVNGVLSVNLGRLGLSSGIYNSELLVFDDLNDKGIFWGFIRIRIID